jgi:predicted site-specific integrase-resolvase
MARKSRKQIAEQTKVIGYVRVSSEHQVDQGVSLICARISMSSPG